MNILFYVIVFFGDLINMYWVSIIFKCMDFSSHLMILTVGKHIFSQKNLKRFYTTATKMSTGENVGVPLQKVTAVLETFAPKQLSESWDNTGLLVQPYTPR